MKKPAGSVTGEQVLLRAVSKLRRTPGDAKEWLAVQRATEIMLACHATVIKEAETA